MPELPEVETIRLQLSRYLPIKITKVDTSDVVNSIAHTPLDQVASQIIEDIQRKGKMLIFILNDGSKILSHLGMTGSWRIGDSPSEEKHTHIIFHGQHKKKKKYLCYVDPRRFGHLYHYPKEQAEKKLSELGTDLLSPEFDLQYFSDALKKYPNRLIKVTLLDQKLFAGTGNYIASEVCARAYIRPDRKVETLSRDEIKRLHQAVSQVVRPATQTGGTTFQGGYSDAFGNKGDGVQHLVVFYQKICQQCMKNPVTKIVLAQRGTYFCSKCQK
jgi:formamidopyrimidine-DNA glycosylase